MDFRHAPARASAVGLEAMVASSQPLATLSGLDMLRDGGNAVDAAVCMAAVLTVTEPASTGVGGDLFAVVREPTGALWGLDSAGPAPAAVAVEPPEEAGPRSVDVPGAVAGWGELAQRFGRAGLERCLRPAIALAGRGVAAGANTARAWRASDRAPRAFGSAPTHGERFVLPGLAATLEHIAADGPQAFYAGAVARAITEATWLTGEDLGDYRARWVKPLVGGYRGLEVAELPPPSQGVAVLEALAILGDGDPGLDEEVSAVALALQDALATVRDGAEVGHLLDPEHITRRRRVRPPPVAEPAGGTVCLCAVDADGLAVSVMQSLFDAWGSGVIAGDTGVVLNNRAACFGVEGQVTPGRRPYHTLTPAMLMRDGELVGPFGVMGDFIQAQAAVQFLTELVRNGGDPQAALDRGRFRIDGETLALEEPLWPRIPELTDLGFRIQRGGDRRRFGGGQAIIRREGGGWLGGSDARKDGCALGI
ncbi:MAG TPA: gamma-glutamyltransferase [Solirubrobacteraceae bacterium]|nr:gamma-glutamyltransferase [Solirubrobacteraceae bacterium]